MLITITNCIITVINRCGKYFYNQRFSGFQCGCCSNNFVFNYYITHSLEVDANIPDKCTAFIFGITGLHSSGYKVTGRMKLVTALSFSSLSVVLIQTLANLSLQLNHISLSVASVLPESNPVTLRMEAASLSDVLQSTYNSTWSFDFHRCPSTRKIQTSKIPKEKNTDFFCLR